MIEFSKYKEKANRYLGSEKKKTIVMDGKQYLVKFPDPTRDKKNVLSYINNVYAEYLGCHIFGSVGIPVQKTIVGTYRMADGREKIICACEDFTDKNKELIEFEALFISNVEMEKASSTLITDIIAILKSSQSLANPKECIEQFWNMFIVDSLIGNTDRHNSNWGFLSTEEGENLTPAPIYDCGSSLMPLLSDSDMENLLENRTDFQNISTNIYSCLRVNGGRINYSSYFKDIVYADIECRKALMRIMPVIDIKRISEIIDTTEGISNIRKQFYKDFIEQRYDMILQPAYKRELQLMRNIRLQNAPEL